MDTNVVSGSDWAGLAKHLLDLILEKLVLFSDYARFSSVCVPWYCVAVENRHQFLKKYDRQVPMLLFPKKGEEKGELKSLYDIIQKKIINVEIRLSYRIRYVGSSRGWLITIGEDFVVTLINPISGTMIKLPPISKNETFHNYQIRKAILSADPTTEPNDYTVVAIYGDQAQLAFIKPGRQDDDWTYIDKISTTFDDIIYYNGRLHASDYACKCFSFDENVIDSSSVPRELSPTPNHIDGKSYLVESLEGDLLLVYRHFELFLDYPEHRITLDFQVFKRDPSRAIWVKRKSLGGESLFLGDNMSISILASEVPGCYPNSIYFAHDFDDILRLGQRGPIDMGVFNLDNSSFAPHYVTDEASLLAMAEQPPIWFVPNFLSVEPVPIGTLAAKS